MVSWFRIGHVVARNEAVRAFPRWVDGRAKSRWPRRSRDQCHNSALVFLCADPGSRKQTEPRAAELARNRALRGLCHLATSGPVECQFHRRHMDPGLTGFGGAGGEPPRLCGWVGLAHLSRGVAVSASRAPARSSARLSCPFPHSSVAGQLSRPAVRWAPPTRTRTAHLLPGR